MKLARLLLCFLIVPVATISAFGTAPLVTVTSPASGSQEASPVTFTASATSPQCSKGIAALRIYTAPGVAAYTVDASTLNTPLAFSPGFYHTVVQAWDNCGGVGRLRWTSP